jgi:hypothetical protein
MVVSRDERNPRYLGLRPRGSLGIGCAILSLILSLHPINETTLMEEREEKEKSKPMLSICSQKCKEVGRAISSWW